MTHRPATAKRIAETIVEMVAERGAAKTVCPSEVARRLAGSDEKVWRLLMDPIKAEAVRLAKAGAVTIRRKGRVIDPSDLRGIYRLGVSGVGAGNKASVLPET